MRTDRTQGGSAARYGEIAQILARHGLGYLVAQLGLQRLLPSRWGGGAYGGTPSAGTTAERLRLALEDLGVTFIKLGQILSSRADLLPPDVAAELARLQDAVPPEPMTVVEEAIRRELGQPSAALFAYVDPQPLGSASIGQAHAARLHTGEEVAIKVQRPGVEARVTEDLAILGEVARLAQAHTPWGRIHNLPAMAEEFAETLRSELDFIQEGRNAELLRENLGAEPLVRVPGIYWSHTTRRLLTMELIPGIKISDTEALRAAGVDLRRVAETIIRLSVRMVLRDGFYHADPHPGNLVVQPDGVIGLLDHGMVGVLDEQGRRDVLLLLLAMVEQDLDRLVDQLLALGIVATDLQLEGMKRDMARLLSPNLGLPGRQTDVRRYLEGVLLMSYRRRLVVPPSLALMCKTIMMHEALARQCDPECDTAGVLGVEARRLALQSYLPERRAQQAVLSMGDLGELARHLPRRLHRLLLSIEQGRLLVNIRLQETEQILAALNRMANRLALAIVAAGLTIGIALLLQAFGVAGFSRALGWFILAALAAAMALGVWLIVSILRRPRP